MTIIDISILLGAEKIWARAGKLLQTLDFFPVFEAL